MLEWPPRCTSCKNTIDDWKEAGLHEKKWIHKACYTETWNVAHNAGTDLPELRSPVDRSTQLDMPMLLYALMFHFGLGFAVIGWIMIDQSQSADLGVAFLVVGILVPMMGIAGVALNVISRRRIHMIEQELKLAGGWKPGH